MTLLETGEKETLIKNYDDIKVLNGLSAPQNMT